MGEEGATKDAQQGPVSSMDISVDLGYKELSPNEFDDDGRPKRTGTMLTVSSHIITAVIGSGVLSLAWSIAQLGWAAGPITMIIFALVTYYTSSLLADCYRSGDPITGKRNYTYMEVVRANLGGVKVKICGYMQYLNLFGVAIGYTVASSVSMAAIKRSNCFHAHGKSSPCHTSSNNYMLLFGITQILLSQIPNFEEIWWLSILASLMSFTYSSIGLALGISQVISNSHFKGNLTGISPNSISHSNKIFHIFQAFGDIAFAYSYSNVLIEIQDTIKSPPPSESQTMKKSNLFSIVVTTSFYMLCAGFGYAAFGDSAPGNLLTGFGFYNPFWLLDIANVAIVVHLVGAYQVFTQPLFAFVEKFARGRWPNSRFVNRDFVVSVSKGRKVRVNLFRVLWRTVYVILTTLISMMMPFFNDIVGLIGALGFWPLTVYFPVEMYIVQQKLERWSRKWVCLQLLSVGCLVVSAAAAIGSVASIVDDLKVFKPFDNNY